MGIAFLSWPLGSPIISHTQEMSWPLIHTKVQMTKKVIMNSIPQGFTL